MKKYLIALLLTLTSLSAYSAEDTPLGRFQVRVGGKVYSTGYIPRETRIRGTRYEQFSPQYIADLPESWDERTDRGCVTDIRDQGNCGSCWAFSRTAALEAAKCIAGKTPAPNVLNLAEEDTVANDRSAYGCNGGFMGFDYEVNHGVTLESICPYTARGRACNGAVDTKGLSWTYIGNNGNATADELRAAIYKYGVVSVTTAAGGSGYDTDSNGVFIGCNARGINHMTDFIGYRKIADGSWQFLMRNSWGTSWGTNGYGWMKQGCNQTGVGSESAAVVVVDGPGPAPAIKLNPPLEVLTAKGVEVYLSTEAVDGVSYVWTYGNVTKSGAAVWITADASTKVTLTGTDKNGAKLSQIIDLTVE